MDERWVKALRAKGINVGDETGNEARRHRADRGTASAVTKQQTPVFAASRAKPFKATGHKGGISRQGN